MKLLELNVFWVGEFPQIVNGKIRMGVGLKATARIVSRYLKRLYDGLSKSVPIKQKTRSLIYSQKGL